MQVSVKTQRGGKANATWRKGRRSTMHRPMPHAGFFRVPCSYSEPPQYKRVAKEAKRHSQNQILKPVHNAPKTISTKWKQQRGRLGKKKQNDQNLYKTLLLLQFMQSNSFFPYTPKSNTNRARSGYFIPKSLHIIKKSCTFARE